MASSPVFLIPGGAWATWAMPNHVDDDDDEWICRVHHK